MSKYYSQLSTMAILKTPKRSTHSLSRTQNPGEEEERHRHLRSLEPDIAAMSPRRRNPSYRRALFLGSLSLLGSLLLLWKFASLTHSNTSHSASDDSGVLFPYIFPSSVYDSSPAAIEYTLEKVLKVASMDDNTVILTTLNEAWAAPNSIIDLFLESFRIGNGTFNLLNHLVIVALDEKAYKRCLEIHKYCFSLVSEGVDFHEEAFFMTPDYLKMMWRRIDFLRSVLRLGYNFVFTDADIMWFRDPFPRFDPDADFQVACDHFFGNPESLHNRPNGGFMHVKSNNRTIEFYDYWYNSHNNYSEYHDQDVLNIIKFDPFIKNIGLRMRFLETVYFGGLCEPSRDLNLVCTMHANCCFGISSKLHDLRVMLQDWKLFVSLPPTWKSSPQITWRVPDNCSLDAIHEFHPPIEP